MKSNILIIGSGAREHAIARAIAASSKPHQLYCYGSGPNPGILPLCLGYQVGSLHEPRAIADYARAHAVDFAIVGPEAALAAGVVDALHQKGINAIGPSQKSAQIESSKGFTRDLMQKYKVPGAPRYQRFTAVNAEAHKFLQALGEDFVVKADGLMSGKGVKISGEHLADHAEAIAFCQELNSPFVLEEKLRGVEFSLLSFSDGKNLIHMPPVQDHKRAYSGDIGPNTGGMGSYTMADHSLPFLDPEDVLAAQEINEAAVTALQTELNEQYQGILYGGFMKTAGGVKLIEYNARFGDPEAINLLGLLESDFIDICHAMINGSLNEDHVKFKKQASVCKYLVPKGYPDAPERGLLDISQVNHLDRLYYAGVEQAEQGLLMTGSRAIAVLGVADDLQLAEQQAESTLNQIAGPAFHRPDIGTCALVNQRIEIINQLTEADYPLL